MALIRNGGKYKVKIAVSSRLLNPGDHSSILDSEDLGSGVEEIPEGECRYIGASKFSKDTNDSVFAIIAGENGYVITSARIGPHDILEFNGEKFLDVNQVTGDCKKNHGW